MTPELQSQLYDRWPEIFREQHLDWAETGMCWGIECPDAWAPIIDALCQALMLHAKMAPHPIPSATRVKEKFGSLRFHIGMRCEFCNGAIEMARSMSERVPKETLNK